MKPPHGDISNDAGAYALGSLDADERAAFDAHLADCAECAAEVRSLRTVTDVLARGVSERTPRPELRERIIQSLPGASSSSRAQRTQPNWLSMAAILVVALGLGVYAVRLQMRVADLGARLQEALVQAAAVGLAVVDAHRASGELQSSMNVLTAPDLVRIDLLGQPAAPQARGRALWSRARGMVFAASDLPSLPEGRVYQVWVVAGPAPLSAGLVTPDPAGGGLTFFATPPNIAPPTAVAVTIEPAGGLPAPTGAFYLLGTPSPAL